MIKFFAQDIPNEPGVYIYRNETGEVIYVGKAKSLRRRMSSYFQASRRRKADNKLRALINSIASFEFYVVKSESEALVLEDHLIKQHNPRYNIDLRDDKRYFYVVIDLTEKFPVIRLERLYRDDARLYFGPFPGATTLRLFVEKLSLYLKIRICQFLDLQEKHAEHCLNIALGICSMPCIGSISQEDYKIKIDNAISILRGNYKDFAEYLSLEMKQHVSRMEFEKAAEYRDILEKINDYCSLSHRSFRNWKLSSQQGAAEQNVLALKEVLGILTLPNHIECLDMSHLGGTMAVGSVVCFKQGKASTKDYRRFKIQSDCAIDDTRRMKEVMERRYSRSKEEGKLPDLIVVDGGKPQLNIAVSVLQELELMHIPIIGLAERFEEIFLPGEYFPIVLPLEHGALKLLRAIRDEAHRFAVGYNRLLRRKKIVSSVLDKIPGVGTKRRILLLKEFGSITAIKKASINEIMDRLPGFGEKLATEISKYVSKL